MSNYWINDDTDCYCCECSRRLEYGSCPECDRDSSMVGHDAHEYVDEGPTGVAAFYSARMA